VFPAPLPAEYELQAVFRRQKHPLLRDALVFVLPVGNRHALVLLNAYSSHGFLGGIETDETPLYAPPAEARKTFINAETDYTARCIVRAGSIQVLLNDEEVARWDGDPESLHPNPSWLRAARRQLAVSTWRTQYTVSQLHVTPLATADAQSRGG
jgi:hypothetical protein